MRELCERIAARSNEIIERWEGAARREPWLLLPEEKRTDHLPEVIDAILTAVMGAAPTREQVLSLARHAARHGEDRVQQGIPDSVIMTEYYLLRTAIWEVTREVAPDPATGVGAIQRIDSAISFATRASIIGYHKAQLASRGDWEGVLESLADSSPLAWRGGSSAPPD